MKILALADVHGAADTLGRILATEGPVDAIVVGGDLTTHGTAEDAGRIVALLQVGGPPVLVVAGNMDPAPVDEELVRLGVSVNGTGRVVGDVGFFGVSGSPFSPLHTPNEVSEEEIARRAEAGWKAVAGSARTVFVPHAPPHRTHLDRTFLGMHAGSRAVRECIELYRPDVVICGHIHEARGIETIGKTTVINCGPAGKGHYGLITIGPEIIVRAKNL